MSFHDYTPILNLNSCKVKWTIRVRAQAIWKGINRETKEFKGYNILFFDDSKCRIHAFVNAKFVDLFEKNLEEGQIYKISNFIVKEYLGHETNRCVRNEKHIFFAAYTVMEKDSTYKLKIPRNSFDFSDLRDIPQFETDTRFLCDVVGVIIDKDDLREYLNDKNVPKKQMNFSITDGRYIRKVNFFDEFAQMVEDALAKVMNENTVIVITCAKVHKFQGELYLTNYPASRFYLHANHYAVEQLKLKAIEPTFYRKKPEDPLHNMFHTRNVRQIKELKDDFIGKKVVCEIIIKQVEEQHRWYYYVCNTCEEELQMEDGRYKCKPCKRTIPFPDKRYRLYTVCTDQSGLINIIFPDREVRRLTANNVFDLELEEAQMEDKQKYPAILRDIEMKRYTITLMINEDNVKKGNHFYQAIEVLHGSTTAGPNSPSNYTIEETNDNIFETEPEIVEQVMDSEISSANNQTITDIETTFTPPSAPTITKTSAIKSRARKSNEQDDYEKDESLAPVKFKNMKREKVYNKRS